eukprot:PhF_6_TR10812/c0_g1_i1/m.17419
MLSRCAFFIFALSLHVVATPTYSYPRTFKLHLQNKNDTAVVKEVLQKKFDVWRVFQNSIIVLRIHSDEDERLLRETYTHHQNTVFKSLEEDNDQEQQASGQDMFSDLARIETRMRDLEAKFPNIAKLYDIGTSQEESRPVYALKLAASPLSDDTRLPEVVITGVHHAREWISAEVPMGVAEHICNAFATNSKIRRILSLVEMWIIPVMNPDGYAYTFQSGNSPNGEAKRLWRKNRRGGYGVDPNRNYDAFWYGGQFDTNESDTFRGASPFSEKESQNIRALVGDRQQNISSKLNWLSNPIGFLSYHSYGRMLLYPWGGTYNTIPNVAFLRQLLLHTKTLIQETTSVEYEVKQACDLYIVNGDAADWFMQSHELRPAYSIELRPDMDGCCDFRLPGDQIGASVQEGIVSSLYFAEYLGMEGVKVVTWGSHVFQENSGANQYDEDNNGEVDYTQVEYGPLTTTFFDNQNRTKSIVLYPQSSDDIDIDRARLELAICIGVLLHQVHLRPIPDENNKNSTCEMWLTFPGDLLPTVADDAYIKNILPCVRTPSFCVTMNNTKSSSLLLRSNEATITTSTPSNVSAITTASVVFGIVFVGACVLYFVWRRKYSGGRWSIVSTQRPLSATNEMLSARARQLGD